MKSASIRHKTGSILGSFSKGVDGSVSLNFGVSGGPNCDAKCRHHPESTAEDPTFGCYAVRLEQRHDRTQLAAKLQRHQQMPAALVCGRAILELQELRRRGKRVVWLRISTNGSLPQPEDVRPLFRSQFRALLAYCRDHDIPVHIPVETGAKARFYRHLVGDLGVIRESADSTRRWREARHAVSYTAPKGNGMLHRIELARECARKRFSRTGRRTIVCPAVVSSFRAKLKLAEKNPKALCGSCTACANADLDIVYPHH